MKKLLVLACFCLATRFFVSCLHPAKKLPVQQALQMYKKDIESLNEEVALLLADVKANTDINGLRKRFLKGRMDYKQLEWLAEYYSPYTAKHINGPAVSEVEADQKSTILQPEGFAVIEKLIFPRYDLKNKEELLQQTKLLQSNIGRLQFVASTTETTDAHIFDALRLEVFRIITLGITGFDSPLATNSIGEAAAALGSIQKYVSVYNTEIKKKGARSGIQLHRIITRAQQFLSAQESFNAFDRMTFIAAYLNPLSGTLHQLQTDLAIPFFTEPRALRADAVTLFSRDVFNPDFYVPNAAAYSNRGKVVLGEKLFYDVILSSDGRRSCATCHQPANAFTDGLKTNKALDGKAVLRRNTPTLLNAALQPSLFYDTRVSYLEDQAAEVISNKDEMHGSFTNAIKAINRSRVYKHLFDAAYKGEVITEGQIKNALAAYIRSLVALNAPFDRYMQGNKEAMTGMEIRGFNLFMGKARCGTCHFAPLFNGATPPQFSTTEAEVIGVPATRDTLHALLDNDNGKYEVYKIPLHKNAFKIPGLRNSAVTAPYMHNGVFATLKEVVDFYDRGGGKGLGLAIENQTLPGERLQLTRDEKEAIIAFLKTLTDTGTNPVGLRNN